MLHEFEEYRPYAALAVFHREIDKYVDDTELARLEQYVFVPIDLNTASDADILTIPGLGSRMLREFKEYRPTTASSGSAGRLGSTSARKKSRGWSATSRSGRSSSRVLLQDLVDQEQVGEQRAHVDRRVQVVDEL